MTMPICHAAVSEPTTTPSFSARRAILRACGSCSVTRNLGAGTSIGTRRCGPLTRLTGRRAAGSSRSVCINLSIGHLLSDLHRRQHVLLEHILNGGKQLVGAERL